MSKTSDTALCCVAALLVAMYVGIEIAAAGEEPAGQADSVEARLQRARQGVTDGKKRDESLSLCDQIVADPKAQPQDRAAALEVMLDIRRRQGKTPEIIAAAQRIIDAFPKNAALASKAYAAQADALWRRRKREEAIARLDEFLKLHGADKAASAPARAQLGPYLLDTNQYDRCYAEASQALQAGLDEQETRNILGLRAEAMWRKRDLAACAQAEAEILSPAYAKLWDDNALDDHRRRRGECLLGLQRYQDARELFQAAEKAAPDPKRSQYWAMRVGEAHLAEKQYDAAVAAYERVFVDHADVSDFWYDAQRGIAQALTQKADWPAALKAWRICLDAAPDEYRIRDNIQAVAMALKSADGNLGRANAFILFQKHGPPGPDGKPATPDDLANPLAGVGYPAYPAREKAFERARKEAGDDDWASRHRALTFLYTGKPAEALRMYLDAFARSGREGFERIGKEMILIGARAAQGHGVGLERFFEYVNYGPAGPDGKAGTPDDLADPFRALAPKGSAQAPAGSGGAADLTEKDRQALREARRALKEFALSDLESYELRRDALAGLVRVEQALMEPQTQEPPDWYLRQAAATRDQSFAALCLAGAEFAAKAGAIHLGAVHAFWKQLDSADLFGDRKVPGPVQSVGRDFQRVASAFEKPRLPPLKDLQTWKVPAANLNLTTLRPFPEQK